jgi:hypothetical protein
MRSLSEYLELAAVAHGHICAGQVLGVRLAMLGLRELGITDPIADRKRLVTYVEIDRCVTDAVALVANCRLGKRALKFRDWGKVAATFCDLETGRAVRIAAKESSKQAAKGTVSRLASGRGPAKSLRATFRRRSVLQGMGESRNPSGRFARLQGPAHCLRPVRRRDQLQARSPQRRPHPLSRLRWRALLLPILRPPWKHRFRPALCLLKICARISLSC